MTPDSRRTLLARLIVIAGTGYVAPRAVAIAPAVADKGKCPACPFGNGNGVKKKC
jgi:hypothetical protein